jgi:hypothetical protein
MNVNEQRQHARADAPAAEAPSLEVKKAKDRSRK